MSHDMPAPRVVVVLAVLAVAGCGADQQNTEAGRSPATDPTTAASSPETAVATRPTSPTASTPTGPQHLLPNMRSLPAGDIHIQQGENGRELRFSATLANFGVGPLVLEPSQEQPCPEGQRFASQLIYTDGNADGVFDAEADTQSVTNPAGCMVFHPTHGHWHFDSSAGYVLSAPGAPAPVASTDKVSFCMRDSRPLRNADVTSPETYGECERDKIQGISAGWGDVYDSDLDGQALDLQGVADGVYCLQLTSDPFDLLRETDETDNSSVVAIDISGTDVSRLSDASACQVEE